MQQTKLSLPEMEAQLIEMKSILDFANNKMLTSTTWVEVQEARRQELVKEVAQYEKLIGELRK